jgi:hypothetical protein
VQSLLVFQCAYMYVGTYIIVFISLNWFL